MLGTGVKILAWLTGQAACMMPEFESIEAGLAL